MIRFIGRRLAYALFMTVLVSFVGFMVIELPPGDFLTQKLAELQSRGDRSAELHIDEYRARYGLDKPLLARYGIWAANFLRGDFGESFEYERPVRELIVQRIGLTLVLAFATLAVTWCIAIPVGVYCATRQYSAGDQIVTTLSFIGLGTPGFLLALVVLFFATVVLRQDVTGLFSRQFADAPWSMARVFDLLKHLWVPACVGAVTGSAGLI